MDLSRLLCTPRTPRFRPFERSPSASPSSLRLLRQTAQIRPKKPRSRELTRDERLKARTLVEDAKWPREAVATLLKATPRQVQWALDNQLTPQKNKTGRRPLFDTPKRVELQRWFLSNPAYRYMAWEDLKFFLPPELYTGEYALCRALRALGYTRRLRRRRIRRTAANKRARVQWCQEMKQRFPHPTDWEWVIFSDETWAVNDPMWKQWVTIHNMEDPNDFALLRHKPQGWMFWGCFAGGKRGPGYFWEKGYGGINQYKYCFQILPIIRYFRTSELGGRGVFQQDNAPSHRAKGTKEMLRMMRIPVLQWPANSPDLNPIENVWFVMKNWIENHYDIQSLSLEELREAIQEAWESIDSGFLLRLAHGMPGRLQKCIDAGGNTIDY